MPIACAVIVEHRCRLEQWAGMAASSSTDHMWLFEDGKLNRLAERPQWIAESVNVFTGNFTCASDKEKLVDVMMALYSFTIACGRYNSEKEGKPIKATSRYQVSPIEEEVTDEAPGTNDEEGRLWLSALIDRNRKHMYHAGPQTPGPATHVCSFCSSLLACH